MDPEDSTVSGSDIQEQAYHALNEYFSAHQDEVVEIEVVPPAIQPPDGVLLQDGLYLGVPKKILAMAFVKARRMFFERTKSGRTPGQSLQATRVMLLFDPEHITAANFRKRWILGLKTDKMDGDLEYIKAVTQELVLLNSILTSPLHRQSKSPTLWHHRAWLLDLLLPIKLAGPSGEPFLAFVRAELDAVLKAGERHPRNYYAWLYSRRLCMKIEHLYVADGGHSWKASYHELLVTCALLVKAWCCKHPSDISGWAFLHFLLPRLKSIPRRRMIVMGVLEYAINLQLEQESLWVFLRTVLGDSVLQEERDVGIQLLRNHQIERASTDGKPPPESRITQAVNWIELHSAPLH